MHGYGEIRRKNFRVLRRFHENAVKFTRCTDVNVLAFPQFWTDSRDFLCVRARITSTKLIPYAIHQDTVDESSWSDVGVTEYIMQGCTCITMQMQYSAPSGRGWY